MWNFTDQKLDLGLAATKKFNNNDLNVILVFAILLSFTFLCYALLRLGIVVVRGDRSRTADRAQVTVLGHGYAMPRQPIQVVMAQDEEAQRESSEWSKTNPPAYGYWRESVVS